MRNPVSRFAYSKSDIGIKRSKFSRSFDHKTTISGGLLYPLMVDEVLPGDTYSVDLSSLVRMSTPIHPVMDNCYLDVYFFFVPNRIVWKHWKEFMGEASLDPYISPIEYTVPQLVAPEREWDSRHYLKVPYKSILDYLGVPAGTSPKEFDALKVRGFCLIWNEWFRDQNLQNPINIDFGDANATYAGFVEWTPDNIDHLKLNYWDYTNKTDPNSYVTNAKHGGDLPPVNKYHDYFTSALKEPQKGDPVAIPLNGFAPVYARDIFSDLGNAGEVDPISVSSLGTAANITGRNLMIDSGGHLSDTMEAGTVGNGPIKFNNLISDLSFNKDSGIYATINDLRYAFQLQKFLEADNRGGTRYREILKQHFNVTSPDASQQIPEFLGGKRIPINISQVLQTSSTDSVSPQGNTAAYSLTSDRLSAFTKSFTEHGHIYCVGCIRTDHTYSEGLERTWFKKNKFDYYFPEFANISEQPIYNKEIYITLRNAQDDPSVAFSTDDEVFGYQEAWSEYRYKPNRLSGEFRPSYPQSLSVWHYGDDYASQPHLSSEWIRETRSNIDRTLAVTSPDSDQFICDFYFKMDTVRAMPVYSIPGLVDHH